MRNPENTHIETLFNAWMDSLDNEDTGKCDISNADRGHLQDVKEMEKAELTARQRLIKEIEKGEGYTIDAAKAFSDLCYYGMKAAFFNGFKTAQDLYK